MKSRTDMVEIEFIIATTHFYRGEQKPENELLGVIYGCTIKDPGKAKFGEEHSEQRWVTAEQANSFLPPDHWLIEAIHRAEMLRRHLSGDLRRFFVKSGLEI